MTVFVSFLLRCLPFLCVLFGANTLVPSTAWGYDLQARPSIVYDGASLPVFDYDSASTLSANENENRIWEKGGAFAQFSGFLAAKSTTYLYQKLGADGEHLKFGITDAPATRYTEAEMNGGKLNIIARGTRDDMLELERNLHETLPIGPEEGQKFYIQMQINKGLTPPPYQKP